MMKTDYKSKRLCVRNILNIYAMYNHNSNNAKNLVSILLIIYIAQVIERVVITRYNLLRTFFRFKYFSILSYWGKTALVHGTWPKQHIFFSWTNQIDRWLTITFFFFFFSSWNLAVTLAILTWSVQPLAHFHFARTGLPHNRHLKKKKKKT